MTAKVLRFPERRRPPRRPLQLVGTPVVHVAPPRALRSVVARVLRVFKPEIDAKLRLIAKPQRLGISAAISLLRRRKST